MPVRIRFPINRIRPFLARPHHFPYSFEGRGPLPPPVAEQKETTVCCSKLKTTGTRGVFRVNAEPLCDGTLSSAHPAAAGPCRERDRATQHRHTACALGTRKLLESSPPAPYPTFLWDKSHFHLHVHST